MLKQTTNAGIFETRASQTEARVPLEIHNGHHKFKPKSLGQYYVLYKKYFNLLTCGNALMQCYVCRLKYHVILIKGMFLFIKTG